MSAKIKAKIQDNKITKSKSFTSSCASEQYPWFSFQNLTRNSNYNLNSLPQGREKEQTLSYLIKKLENLSSEKWIYWQQNRKNCGLETLTYDQLSFKAKDESSISHDTTIYVFRFDTHKGTGKGRIIGYKNSPCSVLQIIGFDIDFTGYNH